MDPNDIPDADVREWYRKKNSVAIGKIIYVSVEDLSSKDFDNPYITGYKQYITSGHLSEDNPYWQYVLSLRNSVTTQSGYNVLSIDRCRKKTINRFKVIESILQDGYDVTKPVILWTLKFTKNTRCITSREGQVLEFNGFDGHHRIASAKEIGLRYVPAEMGSPSFMPITYLEKISKHKKWKWYQPIDFRTKTEIVFDHKASNLHGAEKYNFILREALHPIKERKFIDLGCNTGVITACIAADWAERVIGIDYNQKIEQAESVKQALWADYGNLLFRGINLRDDLDKLQPILELQVDCILMSNFIYYMGDRADDLIDMCSNYANRIVLQGNRLKKDQKQPHYRGKYSQIQGMKELLKRHGYHYHRIIAPNAYPKPVVVGKKTQKNRSHSITQNAKPFEKIIYDLATSRPYWDIAKKRFIISIEHLSSFMTQPTNLKLLNVGGLKEEKEIFEAKFRDSISYESLNNTSIGGKISQFDAKIDKLPFDDNAFDIIVCWETIEHLWMVRNDGVLNADGVLYCWEEMNRVLKPEGLFHLTTTNRFCPRAFSFMTPLTIPQINAFNFTQMDTEIWGHLREFSAEELRQIAKHTNTFSPFTILSRSCYDHMQPETKEYQQWTKRLEQHIQRPLKQEEKYDTLFFVNRT